jgi:hypothetical protein
VQATVYQVMAVGSQAIAKVNFVVMNTIELYFGRWGADYERQLIGIKKSFCF